MLVNAYFDESLGAIQTDDPRAGPRGRLESFCIAGYLIESEQSKLLSQEWQAVLDAFGLPYFHMVDCAHGNGVFSKLTKPQRIQVAARMIGNIKRRTIRGIGVSLNVSQFRALMPPAHPFIKSRYTLCAHALLGGVQQWMKQNKYAGDIAYFFEAGHASQHEANRLMQMIFSNQKLRKAAHYAGHAFVPKEKSAGVQAADLLAWLFHTETRRQIERAARPPRKDYESLFSHPHNVIFFQPDDYIRTSKFWGFDTTIAEANIKATQAYYASLQGGASEEQPS